MDELKNKAPKLSQIKKENPFRAPDNYFDDFSARLQTRKKKKKKVLPEKDNKVIRLLKPVIGLAASFALIVLLVYWPVKKFMNNQVAESEINTESTVSEDLYVSMVEGIDEASFYDMLEEEESTTVFTDDEMINYISANISDYEIYLETNY